VKPRQTRFGKAHDEARLAKIVDLGNRSDAVEEGLFVGRVFGGVTLNRDGKPFPKPIMESDQTPVETLDGGRDAGEAQLLI
jgi:hypothetical protein